MLNKHKKIIYLLLCTILFVAIIFSIHESNNSSKVVRVGNLPLVEGLPMYVAIDNGYFKEAGIDIKFTRFDAPNQLIDALMSNSIDMVTTSGAMGISAIADSKNPGKIKIYGASGSVDDAVLSGLFVRNDSDIDSLGGLKGKKLGILVGIQWRTIATELLSHHNLKVGDDVTLVELPLSLHGQALSSGQVDAVLTLEPAVTAIRENKTGIEITPSPVFEISNPFYNTAGIISTDFVSRHKDLTSETLQILQKANKFIRDNPNEARKHLNGYTSLNDDLLEKVTMPQIKMWNEIDENDIAAIQAFYEIFYKNKVVDKPLDFKSLLYKE